MEWKVKRIQKPRKSFKKNSDDRLAPYRDKSPKKSRGEIECEEILKSQNDDFED